MDSQLRLNWEDKELVSQMVYIISESIRKLLMKFIREVNYFL